MNGHIRQRSAGSWELRLDLPRDTVTGARRTRTETVRGSKRDAQRRLRELLSAVDRGEHIDRSLVTILRHVLERIEVWRASGRISAKTAERHGELARNQVGHIGTIGLQQLRTADVERWHAGLLAEGLSPRTIRDAHHVLSSALDDAVRHGMAVRNVARLQRPPRVARQEVEILAADQVEPVMKALAEHPLRVAVIVALYTGLRRSEQLALRWSDIDLAAQALRVERALEETRAGIAIKPPKTVAGNRTVALPGVVVDALREHRREQLELRLMLGTGKPDSDALVFPDPDFGHQSPRNFTTTWSRTVRRLGLPRVGWHALRHTHASMLIAAAVDIATIAKRLGHAAPTTTLSTFSHCFKRDDRAAADAIDAALARSRG
jgi:integrase